MFINFLGVMLDGKLEWSVSINYIKNKIPTKTFSKISLNKLYKVFILPYYMYNLLCRNLG